MSLRKLLFWTHLVCGLAAGIVIAFLCLTGIAFAFEHEILEYIDRDVARVEVPSTPQSGSGVPPEFSTPPRGAGFTPAIPSSAAPAPSTVHSSPSTVAPLPLSALLASVTAQRPDFKTTTVLAPRDPTAAYTFIAGRDGELYVNPYTGVAVEPRSHTAHDILHGLIYLHRWFAFSNQPPLVGRLITGIANLVLLVLCLTGLWLWFPRRLAARFLRPLLWFVPAYRGKARDLIWHNVLGFWSLPIVLVLVLTGVVISFGWAHDLLFRAFGEKPPIHRDGRMLATPPKPLPAPPTPDAPPLPLDTIHAQLLAAYPRAESIAFTLPPTGPVTKPLAVAVFEPAAFSTRGRIQLELDPWRGDLLSQVGWADRSPGLRARIWVRFLHTGEALGLAGKILASLASLALLIVVWTGFALSWRRFFRRATT